MVEPDAKSPRSDRDEAAMDAARHAAGGMSFDDFKSLIEQEGLGVKDAAAQRAWGALGEGELALDELDEVAAGCEGVELPIVLPGFDGLTETGGSR